MPKATNRTPQPALDYGDRFAWNPRLGKRGGYYDYERHRIISAGEVRRAEEQFIDAARKEMRAATEQLQQGKLTVAEWRTKMREEIKDTQRALGAVEAGGMRNMTQSDWGWVGRRCRTQYEYLDKFANQIVAGQQKLDGRALSRAEMYADAGRATAREQTRRKAGQRGQAQERRQLGAAEHCIDCVQEAAKGWRPLGSLRPIGDSICRTNCKCYFEFRAQPAGSQP